MSLRILTEACDHFHKTALFVHNLSRKADKMVIAYQSNVWLIEQSVLLGIKPPSKIQEEALNQIIEMLGGARYNPYGLELNSFEETFRYIMEKRPDILIGDYNSKKKTLYIHSYTSFEHSPTSSILIKKVVDALGIRKVLTSHLTGENEEEKEYKKKELLGRLPDIMYHGTSSKYAIQILKNGLMPAASPSNYPNVVHHEDEVFLTTKFAEAAYHAEHTVNFPTLGFEVVFGFQIPDKNKLVPDFDIDVSSSQTVWQSDLERYEARYDFYGKEDPKKSMQLSRDFGIVGYSGRIPANFIRSIYIKDHEYYPAYTEVSKENLLSMIYEGVPFEIAREMQEEQEREEQEEKIVAFRDLATDIIKRGLRR